MKLPSSLDSQILYVCLVLLSLPAFIRTVVIRYRARRLHFGLEILGEFVKVYHNLNFGICIFYPLLQCLTAPINSSAIRPFGTHPN